MVRTTAGPGSNIEALLDEYGVGVNSWVSDVFASDTDRLLLALLLEQRGQELVEALDDAQSEYTDEDSGTQYYAQQFTVTQSGPPEDVTDDQGRLDFGFEATSVDLRFTDSVEVAFKPQGNANRVIEYRKQDKHAEGIPVETQTMGVVRADSATSDPTVWVEAWP
ncbi:hypothetical protein [Halorubellus litoreus]|uniref:Uncharacterized protein n=1 Tax=Halorubellus litoreus TaxID=755308 RepID=A0ABD5V9G4_9EURY